MSLVRAALTLAVALPSLLHAALDPAAQQCVRRLAENTAAVATAQAETNRACLRTGGPDAQTCLVADATGAVATASARTLADVRALCEAFPPFGAPQRLAETANAAGTLHERGLVADVFGPDLAAAVASGRREARCQTRVLRRAERVMRACVADYLRCSAKALPTADAASLAACVGQDAPAVARAASRLRQLATGRCARVDATSLFPGRCSGLTGAALATCLDGRIACRACRLVDSAGALGADCDRLDDGTANDSCRIPVSVSGNAIPFNGGDQRIAGAEIWILEHPERRMVTSVDGAFRFDDLAEGDEVTLVLDHPDYHAIQTGTHRLGPQGAERVTFQAVVHAIYNALALLLGVTPDPAKCQIVTTVTRVGRSLYDPGAHGEDGATTVLLGPGADEGPIYFNSSVLPDRTVTETSDDGGVLYFNATPGTYHWTASKPGAAFASLTMTCRPNVLVNASPPWGLQRQ
ncbi:MAG TPA: hypothetical protein VGR62_04205 [Candidatus Binatia bacterium]|jgi:hypothetical protein|nr:hypothetical protein [Candidatus Binatia bacterium]